MARDTDRRGEPGRGKAENAAASSPVTDAGADAPPLLLVHGAGDRLMPAQPSEELHERLTAVRAPGGALRRPRAHHCFVRADLDPLVTEALAFLIERSAALGTSGAV